MLLLKVGKYENLQMFRSGIVYFSPLETFRNDGTLFRGDLYEGKLFIDTKKGFWINGIDFSSYIEEATESFVGSENVVIFCASILDNSNSRPILPNGIDFYDDFYKEMRKFGQYAVVFDSNDLVKHVRAALENKQCASAWGPVTYCDKRDSAKVEKFYHERKSVYKEATIYFLKGVDQIMLAPGRNDHFRLN